jgi:tetratricopeptide (TPR) repeat protein
VSQRFDLGVHFTLTGEYERAVRAFQAVLVDEPHSGRAWAYLGMALAHLGRSAEAEAALARSLSLSPGNGEAWFHLGISRGLRGEWQDAATALRRAVAYLPDDMVAWHRLGVALSESQEPDAAAAAFERALVLSRETGTYPLEEPAVARADEHTTEVLEPEGPRQAQSWLDLALSLLSLGEEEEAVAAYERALALDPARTRSSLFRPMLQLLTLAAGKPIDDEPPTPRPDMPRPIRPFRFEPGDGLRPAVLDR